MSDKFGSMKLNRTIRDNLVVLHHKMAEQNIDANRDTIIVDPHVSEKWLNLNFKTNHCKCITASRGHRSFWVINRKRFLTLDEILRLQGFSPVVKEADRARCGMSKSTFGHAVGNAMHVGVLAQILPPLLYSAGLINRMP